MPARKGGHPFCREAKEVMKRRGFILFRHKWEKIVTLFSLKRKEKIKRPLYNCEERSDLYDIASDSEAINHFCHCEERSDEAISLEIATASLQEASQ